MGESSEKLYFLGGIILQDSLFGTLSPDAAVIGHTIEGAFLIFTHLSTEIAPISLTLAAPFVKFAKH